MYVHRVTRIREIDCSHAYLARNSPRSLDKESATAVFLSFICGREGIQSFTNILRIERAKQKERMIVWVCDNPIWRCATASIIFWRHAHRYASPRRHRIIMLGARARAWYHTISGVSSPSLRAAGSLVISRLIIMRMRLSVYANSEKEQEREVEIDTKRVQ